MRGDILSGDLRLFYLLWLSAAADDLLADDMPEPLPGIGPLTAALEAAAEFFDIDRDLVEAAAASPCGEAETPGALRVFIGGLAEEEKIDLLIRLMEGDAHVGSELRQRARAQRRGAERPRRTVGELLAKAREIGEARERAEAERRLAEERRKADEAERARRARLDVLRRRGERIWAEIETEIERRTSQGYDRAAALLTDLKQLAAEQGTAADARHARKGQFIKRLQGL